MGRKEETQEKKITFLTVLSIKGSVCAGVVKKREYSGKFSRGGILSGKISVYGCQNWSLNDGDFLKPGF